MRCTRCYREHVECSENESLACRVDKMHLFGTIARANDWSSELETEMIVHPACLQTKVEERTRPSLAEHCPSLICDHGCFLQSCGGGGGCESSDLMGMSGPVIIAKSIKNARMLPLLHRLVSAHVSLLVGESSSVGVPPLLDVFHFADLRPLFGATNGRRVAIGIWAAIGPAILLDVSWICHFSWFVVFGSFLAMCVCAVCF